MKTKLSWLVMGWAAFSLAAAEPAKSPDIPALLQRGLFEEEVNRNLEAAVTEYRAAVMQLDRQRVYGATALFRLAECQRKLGRTAEAQALYRRVVQEFPEQTNLVQLSQPHAGAAAPAAGAAVKGEAPAVLDEEMQAIRRIETIVKDSPDMINMVKGGVTFLHTAASRGQLKVVEYLLDHGADIECRTETPSGVAGNARSTPLLVAAWEGNRAMVELLMKRGADVNATDYPGMIWRGPFHQ